MKVEKWMRLVLGVGMLAAGGLALSACCTNPLGGQKFSPGQSMDIAEVVKQVKTAFQLAENSKPDGVDVKTITLDLKGTSSEKAAGSASPIKIFTANASGSKEDVDEISVVFTPYQKKVLKTEGDVTTQLADAIGSVYRAVKAMTPEYKLKSGTVSIKFTVDTSADGKVTLLPLNVSGSYSREAVQTIILAF